VWLDCAGIEGEDGCFGSYRVGVRFEEESGLLQVFLGGGEVGHGGREPVSLLW